jgi:DNA helicase II / ATP-dependent DNA helicase PcrA
VDFERDLNPPQREAVLHQRGPLLVLAGAGSGKTRVITYRIANLILSGVPARGVLAVTFTNKAAGEMRARAEHLLGGSAGGLWIGTFHSICARLLRIYGERVGLSRNFVIYDDDDQLSLIKRVLTDLGVPERFFAPRDVLWHIDRAKNDGVGPDAYVGKDFFSDLVAKVYPEYERRLLAADAADFGDLLTKMVQLLHVDPDLAAHLSGRFEHVLVDEFQDTNRVQYDLVRLLSGTHHNLCVVGDDDQSIYGWRGAKVKNILDFEEDHPAATVIKLEQNYRSTQVILDAAGAVIDQNSRRKPKKLWTDRKGGEPIVLYECEDERAEATFVLSMIQGLRARETRVFGDFAVFYRTHAQSRVIEEALRGARPAVPYSIVGGMRFYDRAEIKDLVAYLKVLVNPADEISLLRIINVPTRGIGTSTIERVIARARQAKIPVLEAARRCAAGEEQGLGETGTESAERADEEIPASATPNPAVGTNAELPWTRLAAEIARTSAAAAAAKPPPEELRSGPRRKLAGFCSLIAELAEEAKHTSPAQLAETVLERTGYLERLAIDGTPEARTRMENLMELISSLRDYERQTEEPTLVGFLEHVSLASDVDSYNESEGKVTLMTVHSAKGLEFPVVFLVGLEQGIFPHARSLNNFDEMEEERRLAYVAITRARQRLLLTYARQRWIFGQPQQNDPSEFLRHIPGELLTAHQQPRAATLRAATGAPAAGSGPSGPPRRGPRRPPSGEAWLDQGEYDQRPPEEIGEAGGFCIGMRVRHAKFGDGEVRGITGLPPNLNLTIYFSSVGPKTVRSQFVQPSP